MKKYLIILLVLPVALSAQVKDSCGTIMRNLGGQQTWTSAWAVGFQAVSTRALAITGGRTLSIRKHGQIALDTVIVEHQVIVPKMWTAAPDTFWVPCRYIDEAGTRDTSGVVILNRVERAIVLSDKFSGYVRVRKSTIRQKFPVVVNYY